MLTYWETLTAIQSNVPVNDSYAQLWGRKSQGYTVVTYIGTLPAVLTGTKAGYLHRYKIFGNTEQNGTPTPENPIMLSECGEMTENLFDESTLQRGYYGTGNSDYSVFTSDDRYRGFKLSLTAGIYTLNITCNVSIRLLRVSNSIDGVATVVTDDRPYTVTLTGNATVYVSFRNQTTTDNYPNLKVMVNVGSTALPYEPYGYKLPLTSAGQSVDIYIGDDTISAEEYIDSGTGKIYHMVDGVLTPTDPPLPFSQIPTSAGSTTIGWAGEGLAPSQVELEYKKKR